MSDRVKCGIIVLSFLGLLFFRNVVESPLMSILLWIALLWSFISYIQKKEKEELRAPPGEYWLIFRLKQWGFLYEGEPWPFLPPPVGFALLCILTLVWIGSCQDIHSYNIQDQTNMVARSIFLTFLSCLVLAWMYLSEERRQELVHTHRSELLQKERTFVTFLGNMQRFLQRYADTPLPDEWQQKLHAAQQSFAHLLLLLNMKTDGPSGFDSLPPEQILFRFTIPSPEEKRDEYGRVYLGNSFFPANTPVQRAALGAFKKSVYALDPHFVDVDDVRKMVAWLHHLEQLLDIVLTQDTPFVSRGHIIYGYPIEGA